MALLRTFALRAGKKTEKAKRQFVEKMLPVSADKPCQESFKMEEAELLNAVFRFKHKTPSDRQDVAMCTALIERFAAFVGSLEAVEVAEHVCVRCEPLADDRVVPASVFAKHELEVLQQVCRRLAPGDQKRKRGDVWYGPWLPMYGCVLQRNMPSAAVVKLEVLFVDGWERTLHFLPSGECIHSAVPKKTHRVAHCADLDPTLQSNFVAAFNRELSKAQSRTGSQRSAAANELGHQKTPQFVAAVVRRAVGSVLGGACDQTLLTPQGGTTDVGQHTGGRPRDTCWPLVQAAIAQNLCCGRGLFRKTMTMFELSLLETTVHEASGLIQRDDSVSDGCALVDDQFYMLEVIVCHIIELLDDGYEVEALYDQCAVLRSKIDGFVDVLNGKAAKPYVLPENSAMEKLQQLNGSFKLDSPGTVDGRKMGEGYESIRDRAWANLEGCQFLDGASCSIAELLEWEKLVDNTAPAAYKTILILRTVETFMFSSSLRLNADRGDAESICPEDLRSLVTVYQRTARQWRQLPRLTSILGVEQRSRELLALWIAFCLVHQTCIESVPLCAKYGIAVRWQDLKVAVASDKAAIQALQRVARYIRRWEEAVGGPPLFHLSNQHPTLDFARTFSGNDAAMAAFYNQEVSAWNGYLQTMWNTIAQKKREAADLRAEIDRLNQGLQETERSLATEVARLTLEENARRAIGGYRWNNIGNAVTRRYRACIRSTNRSISQTEAALQRTIAMPNYLVKPLPPQKAEALQVIFFLTMPRDLEILGDLCLAAQRALASSGPTAEMRAMPNVSPTTWLQYYSQYAQSTTFPRQSKVFTTSPSPYRLPRLNGPQTVDELSSITQYEAQCVWNPTFNGSALTWKDVSGVNVNPFAASPESVLESYTEKLSGDFHQLQWMNSYTGGDTRGNLIYANFSQQPETFEKASFIALGTLRAFPNQQYRKLLTALLEDTLPWSHPSVETIIRQSLYQVGEITADDDARLLWKTDMFDMVGGLNAFCAILRSVASKLEQTPREFQSVPLLSEVAGYLHQFTGEANTIVKAFARMTRRWAEDALLECAKESSASRIAEIRAKECVLYGFALLSYTLGPWDDAVARDVCELLVLFRTSFLCASINRQSSSELLRIQSRIDEVMTRRISTVVDFALERGGGMLLTSLVRLAYRTAPSRLKWNRSTDVTSASAQFGSCVEAFDQPTETHYAINLFTGSVLANGNAPGGLPSDIRDHERFKMLFGLSNFEATSTNGVLRTVREFYDRYYDFALLNGGDLFVQELGVDGNGAVKMTLQLCSLEWIGAFGKAFPARLRELYSHWYWVERDCVLLRPTVANQRRVFFVVAFNKSGVLRCFKVPLSDMERPYQDILNALQQYDSFVRLEQPLLKVLDVLTKFESKQFFHSLQSPQGVLKIELPRFKLTFQLDADLQLESVEHRGYVLAPNQQFDDFLPRFSRYLVLKLRNAFDTSASELRVIVPMGVVKESPGGMVDVDISHEASGNISTACYEEHRRLRVFHAATICARLQLAAIYTRAGTNVPSKRLQMTGAEAALQVLRSCCSSRPFAASETALLLNVGTLSYREPAVKLLAVALLSKAERLAFLFGQEVKTSRAMSSTHENTEYHEMRGKEIQRNPLRSQFRKTEERLALGHVAHAPVCIAAKERVTLDPIPVSARYAKAVETQLALFLSCSNSPAVKMPPLPLRQDNCESVMSKDMLMELQVSWESYHSQAEVALTAPLSTLLGTFSTLLADVGHHRRAMEAYLSSCFDKATASKGDRLLALINYVPTLTVSDLVSCSFDDDTLHTLMPKLSVEDRKQFKMAVIRFMELCVLEDKMERLVWKVKSGPEASISQLVDELSNVRQWQSTEFPYWLAFEVEGRLQIRHEQFVIARHLIEQPGTVCQLNMGRGKTRVILPMLFLHFTRSRCRRIVRAHFLGPLLSEARQFMHRFLSASSARLDIFEQPFHRQVKLGVRGLEIMHDTLEEMKLFGGVQVVAPEHRMSLELKRLELGGSSGAESDEMVAALDTILENDKYIDVLDECDALLHHKYHLVYAVGAPASLCSGVERWKAAEALLGAVASKADSRVAKVLRA
ncbi:hypothetical protein BBJ28_00013892, partial [Nothophytophthora sp. Chile5]